MPVLVDGASRKDPRQAAGRTRCNRVVNFDGEGRDLLGRVVPVRITQALPHCLRGERVVARIAALAPVRALVEEGSDDTRALALPAQPLVLG